MSRRAAQLSLAAVGVLLGLLVVVQIRSQATADDLQARSTQELTVLVANLNDRNAQLRTEVATLQDEVSQLQAAKARGESSVGALRADLDKFRGWSGLSPVTGPGVRLTVAGPIAGEGVMDLLNELRNAGAEAIDVEGVRVVPDTVVAGPAGSLSAVDRRITDPITIDAIGSSETLTGSLTRVGGIVAQLSATYPEVTVTVTPVARLALPATTRSLLPSHAVPRL
ncbi:MAG TPA: DUF881 domain-containing protein [Candidatus Dormibacteraeota bacterium]|nr:DUF881 domain-containing protein [Candidatus Dormibacteraeota bacterium]